LRSSAFVVVMW